MNIAISGYGRMGRLIERIAKEKGHIVSATIDPVSSDAMYKEINNESLEEADVVILMLDATTGQNAVNQAKLFNQTVPLTGLALTKLDGTAKGGVVVAIAKEMAMPICFVGLGEKIEDLRPFDPQAFAEAIF